MNADSRPPAAALAPDRHHVAGACDTSSRRYAQSDPAVRSPGDIAEEKLRIYRSLFESNTSVILLIDPETGAIIDANPSACTFYGFSSDEMTSLRITDLNILSREEVHREMQNAREATRNHFLFRHRLADGSLCDVEVYSGPLEVDGRELLCSVIHDITRRLAVEREREELIRELKRALAEVKTLRGIIPICSGCKKIRDDEGYWDRVETYLRQHTEAEFSHGICPDCMKTLYPDFDRDP